MPGGKARALVRSCTVAEIEQAPLLSVLLASYGEESHLEELGKPEACFATYRAMETAGALRAFGAFDPQLVGVVVLLVYGLPHYAGRRVAALESFFVLPSARSGGTGLRLLRAAEQCAGAMGAHALMVSAPAGGRLAAVMERTAGYRETNRVFTRGLS